MTGKTIEKRLNSFAGSRFAFFFLSRLITMD